MTGDELRNKFDQDWGAVRRFLSAHPLTGAWGFFVVGFALGALAVWIA